MCEKAWTQCWRGARTVAKGKASSNFGSPNGSSSRGASAPRAICRTFQYSTSALIIKLAGADSARGEAAHAGERMGGQGTGQTTREAERGSGGRADRTSTSHRTHKSSSPFPLRFAASAKEDCVPRKIRNAPGTKEGRQTSFREPDLGRPAFSLDAARALLTHCHLGKTPTRSLQQRLRRGLTPALD